MRLQIELPQVIQLDRLIAFAPEHIHVPLVSHSGMPRPRTWQQGSVCIADFLPHIRLQVIKGNCIHAFSLLEPTKDDHAR